MAKKPPEGEKGDSMAAKTLTKDQFKKFTQKLVDSGKVVGAKRKEKKFAFGEILDASELVLDYDVTLSSPRFFFQPPKETLLEFEVGDKTKLSAKFCAEPFVLLGIHTYDMKALNQMDKIWAADHADEHYLARRQAATVVALEPTRASKHSFWSSMDAATVKEGFDLLLTDIGDKFVVEVGTEKGASLLAKHAPDATDSSKEDLEAREKARQKLPSMCAKEREVKAKVSEITELMKKNYEHPVWKTKAEKCYGCGSCNLVCPTCYCFDVKDEVELDMKHGCRTRSWDGCLLEGFAHVGSGENFREHRHERFRHRLLRKTVFVPEKIGELACVGCGRCAEVCLPDITDPVDIINTIKEGN